MEGSAVTGVVHSERHRPPPELRGLVDRMVGYRFAGLPAGIHLGMPGASLTMVIAFDDPMRLAMAPESELEPHAFWGLVGGLHDRAVAIPHAGSQHGMQIDVSPLGARALFGMPSGVVTGDVVHLADVWPPAAVDGLLDDLVRAASWAERFRVLDAFLVARVACAEARDWEVHTAASAAWRSITESHGQVRVDALAGDLGWSRRHLTNRFRDEYGLPPKTMALVMRFNLAMRLLRADPRQSLAGLAIRAGYADQAHMTREWRRICGTTPRRWLADEVIPFVQDAATSGDETSTHD